MQVITDWFRRYFSDPQVVFLAFALVIGFAVVLSMGYMLAPALASIVIAYLLEGLVGFLQRQGWPLLGAVMLVYIAFIAFLVTPFWPCSTASPSSAPATWNLFCGPPIIIASPRARPSFPPCRHVCVGRSQPWSRGNPDGRAGA